ncbi:MAG: ferritin family protein [Candidatus Zixiibacteriota bacterium]
MSKDKSKQNILEPLRIARKLEQEGKQFFAQAAQSTASRLARRTFEFLAKEEDKHLEKIHRFYHSLEQSGGKECPDIEYTDPDSKLAMFNDKLAELKEEFKPTVTDIEAYRLALKFESGTEQFYTQKLSETDNPKIKKFYRWLIEEEKMHSRLLRSCLKFVEDPAEWFRSHKKLFS